MTYHSADQQVSLPTNLTRWWFSVTVKLKCVRWLNTVLAVCVYMSFAKSREWIITLFIHGYKHQSNRKLIKNSQKLFYIFAVWEYWSENHLRELLPQEDCSIEEHHCNWSYASVNQFLVLGALIFSSRCENSNSVFLGQTNYRDKLGRDY